MAKQQTTKDENGDLWVNEEGTQSSKVTITLMDIGILYELSQQAQIPVGQATTVGNLMAKIKLYIEQNKG
jgi:hypothetical protein